MKYRIKVERWIVMKTGETASQAEIDKHKAHVHCAHSIYPTKGQATDAAAWIERQFGGKAIRPVLQLEKIEKEVANGR